MTRHRMAWPLLLSALFVVVAVTTFPWAWEQTPISTTVTPTPGAVPSPPTDTVWRLSLDALGNVVLFASLGFALGAFARRLGGTLGALLSVVLLTVALEAVQTRLPGRDPALRDVVVAAVGAWCGLALWRWAGQSVLDRLAALLRFTERVPAWLPTLAIPVWAALAAGLSAEWQAAACTSNWNDSHPLLIGNEATGDRPWRGELWDVRIFDGVASDRDVRRGFGVGSHVTGVGEAVAAWAFRTGVGPTVRGEVAPALGWRGGPAGTRDAPPGAGEVDAGGAPAGGRDATDGVTFDGTAWLQSDGPATALNRRLAGAAGFAVGVDLATADTTQTGPARIVSLSYDAWHRNLMLGQQGDALVVRLRTPATGRNGSDPEWIVPDVFSDTGRHLAVLTWDGSTARLYVDGEPRGRDFALTAGGALFGGWLDPRAELLWGWQVLLLMLLVMPPAKWAALAASRVAPGRRRALGMALALLTPLAVEAWTAAHHPRPWRWGELAVSLGLALFAVGLTALWLRRAAACRSWVAARSVG